MTTIAYRAGVLVADSLVTAAGMRCGYVRKIAKSSSGWMGGTSGNLQDMAIFNEWIEHDCPNMPPKTDGDCDGFVVAPSGALMLWAGKGILVPMEAEFTAVGSGERYAMAVMEAGLNAKRAVEIACRLDTGSGGELTILTNLDR